MFGNEPGCNAPPDRPCRIFVDDGSQPAGTSATTETFDAVDQYTLQGDMFAQAIRDGTPLEFPLEDAVRNMRVIDAVFRAGESGRFEEVEPPTCRGTNRAAWRCTRLGNETAERGAVAKWLMIPDPMPERSS
jgi:hypothetical protein